jgi:hypothetical protein
MPPRKIQKRLVSTYITRKSSGKFSVRVVRKDEETQSTKADFQAAVRTARGKRET